jgi:integrase
MTMLLDVAQAPGLPATITNRAPGFPTLIYLARISAGSRRTVRQVLEAMVARLKGLPANTKNEKEYIAKITDSFHWGALRYQHTAKLRAELAESGMKASTANKYLAILRSVLKEAWRLGQMNAEDFHRAIDLEPIRGTSLQKGRALNRREIVALYGALPGTTAGLRDACLLTILYAGGLRRAEAAALTLVDFNAEAGALTVRRGKGNKARLVKFNPEAVHIISSWLRVRGPEAGPLVCPVTKGGRILFRHLSGQSIQEWCLKLAGRAGIAPFSPHDLRRTFATEGLESSTDQRGVQLQMGHSSFDTTAKYDRGGERAQDRVAAVFRIPYEVPAWVPSAA